MALIIGGGKPTKELLLGASNSGAASWQTIPASVLANYKQIRMLSSTEANEVVAQPFRYSGGYSTNVQVSDGASSTIGLTTTPTAISSLSKASDGSIAWRINAVDAYNAIALIP